MCLKNKYDKLWLYSSYTQELTWNNNLHGITKLSIVPTPMSGILSVMWCISCLPVMSSTQCLQNTPLVFNMLKLTTRPGELRIVL